MKKDTSSHSAIMKDVFNPASPRYQEVIRKFNEARRKEGRSTSFMSEKNPEWVNVGPPKYPVRDEETSGIAERSYSPFNVSPEATQYREAIQKINEVENARRIIDMREKYKYEKYPSSYSDTIFTSPNIKKAGKMDLLKYDKIKNYMKENYNDMSPEEKDVFHKHKEDLEKDLVDFGVFQKA